MRLGGRAWDCSSWARIVFRCTSIAAAILPSDPSTAAGGGGPTVLAYAQALTALDNHEIAALALTLGVLCFGVVMAVLWVRTRLRAVEISRAAQERIAALEEEIDRMHALLGGERQALFVWTAGTDEPAIAGDTSILTANPVARRALALHTWLDREQADELATAIAGLRLRGEAFSLALTTTAQRHLEAEGRAVGGRAVVRLREVSGVKRDLAEVIAQHQQLKRDVELLLGLVEALPFPVWTRGPTGRLSWANPAFARAVQAKDAEDALSRHLELFDRPVRAEIDAAHAAGTTFAARLPARIAGEPRMVEVIDVPVREGSAGIGIDATEIEAAHAELSRQADAHRRVLDHLSTAVAVFGADHRLAFYNAAYCRLWDFETSSLDGNPTDSSLLDRLRAARKLPEQADFRAWKSALHEAYRAREANEHWWHLPDGRALHVVTMPTPDGGVTYLFDDVTERLELERRFDALFRVQGETLDHLAEGVAVFGSDGRLRLFNPSFARMWKLSPTTLNERPHIEAVIELCRLLHRDDGSWQALRAAITDIGQRDSMSGQFERNDGSVVTCATVPLPDGATLVTFQDVTDTVNVERALRERNEALEMTSELKNDFVHHVSYELRSPLTSIIGFAQMLDEGAAGPLTEKQREYLGYITGSSGALLAIINDILDLATIDAGVMSLDLGNVDIRKTAEAAAEGVKDRLSEHKIALHLNVPGDIGTFVADERRVRQVLYNLLSNAIGFSPEGGRVELSAKRTDNAVIFRVVDNGLGIPAEIIARVFDRFESHTKGSRHRGAGLGLSIVRSLVELHGGTVKIESEVGRGTIVTCVFPMDRVIDAVAAE